MQARAVGVLSKFAALEWYVSSRIEVPVALLAKKIDPFVVGPLGVRPPIVSAPKVSTFGEMVSSSDDFPGA